ncbi:hypothetical protein D4R08_08845 [Corynebacterium xerosis]|nr:hypothetical protein D4R08_08845 [Corynebacterium xerosis]
MDGDINAMLARTGYTSAVGFEIFTPNGGARATWGAVTAALDRAWTRAISSGSSASSPVRSTGPRATGAWGSVPASRP